MRYSSYSLQLKSIYCTILISLTSCYHSQGQAQNTPQAFQTIEQEIEEQLNSGNGPGVSISIHYKDQSFHKGYGFKHIDNKAKVDQNSLFKNASTGKVLVALAILQLKNQGLLDLNQPVNKYIKRLDPVIGSITLQQLLAHTSGLKDRVNDFGEGGVSRQIPYAQSLNQEDFFTQPDKIFSYSNMGYNILGAVVEVVTQKDFNTAMRDLVFEPLDMIHSTYRIEDANTVDIAYGHRKSGKSFVVNPRIPDNARERASGMMLTTARDLNQLFKWLMDTTNQSIQPSIKEELVQIITDSTKTGASWSYGFGLFHSRQCNYKAIWHTGGMPGYSASFLSIPEKQFSIVILTNGSNVNRWKIINTAIESLLEGDCKPNTQIPELQAFTEAEVQKLLGTYTQGEGPMIKILIQNNQPVMQVDGNTYEIKKNHRGQITILSEGKPMRTYAYHQNEAGEVDFLQYWVRAYPKVNLR